MLQAGGLKPVNQATPWINSFVLVEGKGKLGNLKLKNLLAEACVITVCHCRKGYWHQQLDEASSFLTTFNTELGLFWYTVMPFGAKVASGLFQRKLDESYGKLKQVKIITDGIMVVGYKPDHNECD